MNVKQSNPTILLVDNGSTRVDAAVQLRVLSEKLNKKMNQKVHAVSLKHSDKIGIEDINNKLNGIPARVFREFISEQLSASVRDFIILPLFFGNSRALTSFIPDEKVELEKQFGSFNINIAETLYPLPDGENLLIDILYEHSIMAAQGDSPEALNNLVLVDHGSPIPEVTAVRQHIATALTQRMPAGVKIAQASMERRKGKEYDFNGELLEDYLNRIAASGASNATVLLQFLLAGSHAGEEGDIVKICNTVMEKHPNFKVAISPLIGHNEKLIECLALRLFQALNEQITS